MCISLHYVIAFLESDTFDPASNDQKKILAWQSKSLFLVIFIAWDNLMPRTPRTADTLSLLNIVMPYSYPCAYRLSNVIDDRHGDSCEVLKTWIRRKANIRNNLEIRTGKSLGEPTSDDPLWISSLKYPDVAWYRNEVFLQFEVVSNYNLEKTINKMCLGLVDQLRSWKNRRSSVYSVTGFVFPVYKSDKTVEACGRWSTGWICVGTISE